MKVILIIIIAGLLLFSELTTHAQTREVTRSLTLEQLVEDVLRENPQLKAMRGKWEAMQQRPVQAKTLPNPMISYKGMEMVSRGEFYNTEEKRIEVEQMFPWFGKLDLKGKIATKEAEMMGREFEAMAREIVMMTKENYFDLYGVQQALTLTRADLEVLKRMQKTAEAKLAAGEVPQQDVLKAQSEVTMLEGRLLELDAQQTTLFARLNTLLNRRADAPLGLAVTAPDAKLDAELQELFDAAEKTRPEIQRAQTAVARSELERQLMQKEFFPDYNLGLEYRNFRSSDDMVMFSVGVELPIWRSKYRAGVLEAEKMIESDKAALESAQRQTAFDVRDAHFKVVTAQRTVELYRNTLLPQAEARFKASEADYLAGKTDFLDLLESQRFLLNVRVMLVMAEANLGMQWAKLERAVGMELGKK